jgi:superoxide dismutase, Fe-Mn family
MLTLPKLNYPYDALEPYIDARTMEIHYTKHHQAYLDKLNSVLDKHPQLAGQPVEKLLASLESLKMDEKDKTMLRNHGGGHVNHTFFWEIMSPVKQKDDALAQRIVQAFGSVDEFRSRFADAALNRFGSGWAWLVEKKDKSLAVYATPNQDSPHLTGDTPLIGLDVWEHAYYLKYQNRRAEYIEHWWNVLKLL